MWTIGDSEILVNLDAVRSVGLEVSDDRQFVEVQVRWASDGDRSPISTMVVQDFGGVAAAMAAGQIVVDAIHEQLKKSGQIFELPHVAALDE